MNEIDMKIIRNAHWLKCCRLCANSQDVQIPLHTSDNDDGSFDVVENAKKYLNVNLTVPGYKNAGQFPQNVCRTCVQFLQKIDSFALQCTKVQDMFYSIFNEQNIEKNTDCQEEEDEVEGKETNIKRNMLDEENQLEIQNINLPYQEKNYETVPIDLYETKTKINPKGHPLFLKKWKTGLNSRSRGRGRPPKHDKIVPRIRIRAIQPPPENNVGNNIGCNNDALERVTECSDTSKKDFYRNSKIGAAKRKMKVPHIVLPNVKEESESNEMEDAMQNCSSTCIKEVSNDTAPKKLKKSELKALVPSLYRFKCHICDEIFKNWNLLRSHCKIVHGDNAQILCDCGRVLSSRTAVIEHRARHTDSDLYRCDKCDKTFYRKSLLSMHMMSHVPKEEQPFVCCKCARRFHCEALLRNHERVHLPREERLIFQCHLCLKMFSSKSAVSAHQKAVHLKERPFVCDQCGHSFTSKGILQEHLTIHSDDTPWNCSKCDKKFKTKYRLKIHMDTHRETPYQCPKCPVLLSTRRTLRMHLVVHRDTKAYQCSTCGKAFRRAKDLKNHNNLHTGRRPYTCPFCSKTFANGSNCRSHKRRKHPEELRIFESSLVNNVHAGADESLSTKKQLNLNEHTSVAKKDNELNFVNINTDMASELSANVCSVDENPLDVKKDGRLNFVNITTDLASQLSADEKKIDNLAAGSGYASSILSFALTRDQKSSSVNQSNGLIRFSQPLSMDQINCGYSPCHEQDISSSALPAFPGNPFHQSLLFSRCIEPS